MYDDEFTARVIIEETSTLVVSRLRTSESFTTNKPHAPTEKSEIKMSRGEDLWLEDVMSKAIENLGLNNDEVRYRSDTIDGMMSMQYRVCVKFKDEIKGRDRELLMILKKPAQNNVAKSYNIYNQFHNEILFYRIYATPKDDFAKCYYADARPSDEPAIVVENVTKRGYSPYPLEHNAPLEYTLAAFRELGRFHAKGYVMKELQREKFFDIVGQLKDLRYETSSMDHMWNFKYLVNVNGSRAVHYLRRRGHDPVFCDKMEALLSNGYEEVIMKVMKPSEPLATLCHGDFTLSNVLFKMENDGRYRGMLIDFGSMAYSMPAIDLSTYLCASCFNELSENKFFDLMRVYHDALEEYLLDAGIRDIEKYSYDALLEDYRRGALFGFLIASFYTPLLLGYISHEKLKLFSMDWEKYVRHNATLGGDEVSKILANMLLLLRDIGCTKHIL